MRKYAVRAAVCAFALLGTNIPSASAAIALTHAAAFHAYNASQVADIDYVTNAAYNIATSSRSVIAPVNYVPPFGAVPSPASFFIDGTLAAGATLTITVYAYKSDGTLRTSGNATVSVTGTWERHVDLSNLSNTDYVSIFTTLPANSATRLYGVLSPL